MIAVTGRGLVTALGLTPDATWQAILTRQSAAKPMPAVESPLPSGADGYQAADLPKDFCSELPREIRYLRWTIEAALRDANLLDIASHQRVPPARRAIVLGTTLHGMRAGGHFYRSKDYGELRYFLAGDVLRSAIDGLGIGGPSSTNCSACSSSLGSIALGMTMLRTGAADIVIAGGYDTVSEYVWAGFNSLRLIAGDALRPFTRGRSGMKLGEGYAIVVMERADDAARRDAHIHAILSGYGESADAHHLTQPQPQGLGALSAMQSAIKRSDIAAGEIGLISAHATGTPDNDAAEYAAMSQLLGDRLPVTPVVCFKTHIGHTLGAAGAAELLLSIAALTDQKIPQTANLRLADIEFPGLRFSSDDGPSAAIHHTLNTSLGFGGANTSVIASRPPLNELAASRTVALRDVRITGIGVVLPGAVGHTAFLEKLNREPVAIDEKALAMLADEKYEHLLNARRVRRMSGYAKLMLAAASEACSDAKLLGDPQRLAETGAMLGTTHGASPFCHDYYSRIIDEGVLAANPVLFAEGVPNVGAAQLSLMLGLKGGCQTIIGARTAGLDALRLGWLRVASGEVDRLIVGAAEESCEVVKAAYAHCALRRGDTTPSKGFSASPGAVAFVIEAADIARARNVPTYARIDHAAAASGATEALPRTLGRLLGSDDICSDWIGSANRTWLDAIEAHALLHRNLQVRIGGIHDIFGESFSVTPLIGIAAIVLSRRLPLPDRSPCEDESVKRFGTLCTDWHGNAVCVETTLLNEDR